MPETVISYEQFHVVDIRVGQVLRVEDNSRARKPAYVLTIDFGPEIGIKGSSAQLATSYSKQELIGKQVLAVVNFPSRHVAGVKSEVLVLAAVSDETSTVLVGPIRQTTNGARVL